MAQQTIGPSITYLKPSDMILALEALFDEKQPGFIWGPPGIGKTDMGRQVAKRTSRGVRDVRAITLDPVDLRGLPHVVVTDIDSKGKKKKSYQSSWATPDFLPRPEDGPMVLHLSELNAAPALVQAACYQLVLDRRIGEYELPDDCVILADGNGENDGGVTSRMPTPLANRFIHLYAKVDVLDWCTWAFANGIDPMIVAFMRFSPDDLYRFSKTEKAFPTPRSYAFASKMFAKNRPPHIEKALIEGAIGPEAALRLLAFRELFRNLPSIDAIMLNPKTAKVPADASTLYAVCCALATRITHNNIGSIIQYIERFPSEEFKVFTIQMATAKDETLYSTNDYIAFVVAHQDSFR